MSRVILHKALQGLANLYGVVLVVSDPGSEAGPCGAIISPDKPIKNLDMLSASVIAEILVGRRISQVKQALMDSGATPQEAEQELRHRRMWFGKSFGIGGGA